MTDQGASRGGPHVDAETPRGWLWRVAFGLYAAALTLATHVPAKHVPKEVSYSDKLVHLTAFAGLTVLMWLAFRSRRLLGMGLALVAWAAADEFTQQFVGRHSDPLDWIADTLGVALGVAMAAWLGRRRTRR